MLLYDAPYLCRVIKGNGFMLNESEWAFSVAADQHPPHGSVNPVFQ